VTLRYLIVKDFRQFFGEQRLDFASDPQRNVTIIYGHNGAGKTTLLNAFTWALFDATTPAFENPRVVANERAVLTLSNGTSTEIVVRVCFEHNGRTYDVKRSQRVSRDGEGNIVQSPPRHIVTISTPGHGPETHENVTQIIGQILPRDLYNFFFFDGERIEQLVKESESRHLEGAVKVILGLEVLEKAMKHLAPAKKLLKASLERCGAGSAIDSLVKESRELETEIADKREARQLCMDNRAASESQRSVVDDALRTHAASHDKQILIDQLEGEAKELKRVLDENALERRKAVSREGFTAFCFDLANQAERVANDLRTKGQLPAAYQQQFVKDLLQAGICICGTSIHEASKARANVEALLQGGGRRDIESALANVGAFAPQYLSARNTLREQLQKLNTTWLASDERLRQTRERASEERHRLGDTPNIDVARYSDQRVQLQSKIDEDGASIHMLTRELENLEPLQDELEKKISAAEMKSEKAALLQRQLKCAGAIAWALKEILQIRRSRAQQQLDERIKQTYAKIAYKDYVPELTDSFSLRLKKRVGGADQSVAKSTGENQLLSLSFVAALAQLAKERYDERDRVDSLTAYEGGIYPIVMDSPFGTLDETPRREVAFAIPKLAPQVILLVSKSQGLGAVHEQLAPHIGRSYVIVYCSQRADVEQEFIDLDGSQFPYTRYSGDEFEGAVLQEVPS
jgi:DNA sulfur modification protein DndD